MLVKSTSYLYNELSYKKRDKNEKSKAPSSPGDNIPYYVWRCWRVDLGDGCPC